MNRKGIAMNAVLSVAGNIIYTFSFGISWQGHFGGAIAGVLMALVLFAKERRGSCTFRRTLLLMRIICGTCSD